MFLTLAGLITALSFNYLGFGEGNYVDYAFSTSQHNVANSTVPSHDVYHLRIQDVQSQYDFENNEYKLFNLSLTDSSLGTIYEDYLQGVIGYNNDEYTFGLYQHDYDSPYGTYPVLNYSCFCYIEWGYSTFSTTWSDSIYLYYSTNDFFVDLTGFSPDMNLAIDIYFKYIDEQTWNIVERGLVEMFGNTGTQYSIGYNTGYNNGYQDGFEQGSADTYTSAYNQGYTAGVAASSSSNPYTFFRLFGAIADTPIMILRNLLGFDVFGTPAITILMTMITGTIAIYLVRKFI